MRLLALRAPLQSENMDFFQSIGRYLCDPVTAIRDQPSAALSAMDGFAIRFSDLPGPWSISGEVSAGSVPQAPLRAGDAMRIFTGAMLPENADTVLIQENAATHGTALHLTGAAPATRGANVRRRASDFAPTPTMREPEAVVDMDAERAEAFALEFIHGRTPPARWLARPAGVFHTWVNHQRLVALGDLPPWQRLLATASAPPLPVAVTAISGAKVHPTLMHGDFAPWNIRVTKERWIALDWERGETDGIPAWDWFHAVVQPAVLVQKAAPDAIIAQLARLLDSVEFGRYAKLTGMAGQERALALAYVGYCIRVTRQTEGLDRLTALEAMMQTRWFPA